MKTILFQPYQILHVWIDNTVMYRLVLYMLSALAASALILGALGLVAQPFGQQALSLIVVTCVAYGVSVAMAYGTSVSANHHSSVITGLIIFFLVMPGSSVPEFVILAATVAIAIVSKYVLVYRKQHLVNPAALAVVLLALSGFGVATWWVATPWMFLPLLVAGSIVVLKIRKWELVVSFVLTGFLVFVFEGLYYGDDIVSTWSTFFVSYPALFLGFFMLTEPFSMPPTKKTQIMYGVLVGLLSNTSIFKPLLTMTPELALLIGNIAFYPTTLRRKLTLKVIRVVSIAQNTLEVVFEKPLGLHYLAGQYLEWMLPHTGADTRGIRRYFTVASSPTEDVLRVALKVPEQASTFKKYWSALKPGDTVTASQLAGDFVLPKHNTKKIAMVAGGIGVTPFRSQLQFLTDTNDKRDVVLFYANNTIPEIAYGELFATHSRVMPLKTIYILAKEPTSSEYESGYFSGVMVEKHTPDFAERLWYISGPPGMVAATVKTLRAIGVKQSHIKKDFFPGLG